MIKCLDASYMVFRMCFMKIIALNDDELKGVYVLAKMPAAKFTAFSPPNLFLQVSYM